MHTDDRCVIHFNRFQPSLVSMILLGDVVQQCKHVQVYNQEVLCLSIFKKNPEVPKFGQQFR